MSDGLRRMLATRAAFASAAVEHGPGASAAHCDTARQSQHSTDLRVTFAYSLRQAPFEPPLLQELTQLARDVFDDPGLDVTWRLTAMPEATAVLARDGGRLVGFKLGYAMTECRYYSWLGGVHPAARGAGIARQLMRLQHRWLRDRGCSQIETSTDAGNAAMARVNLREGFTECGTRSVPGRVQVLYLKLLG